MKATLVLCLAVCAFGLRHNVSYDVYVSKGGLPLPEALRTGKWYNPGQVFNETFIVGGSDAQPGEFPWIASLATTSHFCGGSVLTSNTILTAAHCVEGYVIEISKCLNLACSFKIK